jgi:LuxR family maltose regulon positive regulatory protein
VSSRRRPEFITDFVAIERDRLLRRLVSATRSRVAVIAAPAGFGKSTVLKQFVKQHGALLGMLVVRKEHANHLRFLEDLLACFKTRSTTAAQRNEPRSFGACGDQRRDLIQELALTLSDANGTIVIDDLHRAMRQVGVGDLISEIVELAPASVHWVLATRSSVDLPMATWFAQGTAGLPIDEYDLRLTTREMHEMAASWRLDLSDEASSALFSFSDGWPAATSFALAAFVRSIDIQEAVTAGRELLYSYIAQQVFDPLEKRDQRFLSDTSLLPQMEVEMLSKAGYDDAASTILRLQKETALINHASEHIYQYQELFRAFLEFQLKLRGGSEYRSTLRKTAQILESGGLMEQALSIYAEAEEFGDVERVLVEHGQHLLDRGFLEEVQKQLFSDHFSSENDRIELSGLRAEVLARLGRFEASNAIFNTVVRKSSGDQRADFAQRSAVSLINQYRHFEASRVLGSIPLSSICNRRLRCRVAATLAAAQSASGKHKLANQSIDRALNLACHLNDTALEVTVLNSAAFVATRAGKFDAARASASKSVAVAQQAGLHNLAARAYSTLANVSSEAGDQETTTENLLRMLECAELAGDPAVARVALMGLCDLASERGDEHAFAELEAKLDVLEGRSDPRWQETLLPAKAMQLAWHGEYRDACDLLGATAYVHANLEQQFLRRTEIALYSAAAGLWEQAKLKLLEIEGLESGLNIGQRFSNRIVKATLLLSVTYVLIGRPRQGVERLRTLERSRLLKTTGLYLLWRVAMIFASNSNGSTNDEWEAALIDLRSSGLAGFALLMNRLAVTRLGVQHRLSVLTPTEMRILQTLTKGRSTKSIAVELNRSPRTVDTHVKAILRKLGCKGRIEAARIAREHGLV